METKSAMFCENFLSLTDCLITPKREGRELGGFDEWIFLWTESRVLEIVADESGLTLRVGEVLRTTVVVARMELLELFCTDVIKFSLEQQESEQREERHMHEEDSSPWTQHLPLTLCCLDLGRHKMGVCDWIGSQKLPHSGNWASGTRNLLLFDPKPILFS